MVEYSRTRVFITNGISKNEREGNLCEKSIRIAFEKKMWTGTALEFLRVNLAHKLHPRGIHIMYGLRKSGILGAFSLR